jgi:glycosyl transferase family 25
MKTDEQQIAFEFNAVFPHKFCINLNRRPDRWKRMVRRFEKHGIRDVVRFPAFDGRRLAVPESWALSPGAFGCLQSHLAIVKQARLLSYERVLIFEDDCILAADFQERFVRYAPQLPNEWDLLIFGDPRRSPPRRIRISRNVVRARSVWRTNAYALRSSIYEEFIALCEQGLHPVDGCSVRLQMAADGYCFTPRLAGQTLADSDIDTRPRARRPR